jgi:hypothetical protein
MAVRAVVSARGAVRLDLSFIDELSMNARAHGEIRSA